MKDLIILNGGKRSVFHRIIAATLYTIIFFVFVFSFRESPLQIGNVILNFTVPKAIQINCYMLFFAFRYSTVIHHHFNLKDKKYRRYYAIGPVGFGLWKDLTTLNYAATNHNNNNIYEVILWDEKNNRYKVGFFKHLKDAQETAKMLAYEFGILFYDKEKKELIKITERN